MLSRQSDLYAWCETRTQEQRSLVFYQNKTRGVSSYRTSSILIFNTLFVCSFPWLELVRAKAMKFYCNENIGDVKPSKSDSVIAITCCLLDINHGTYMHHRTG